MKIIHDFELLTKQLAENMAFTIGTFDGLHRGHKKIINATLLHASHIRGSSCVVTFDNHPYSLINPEKEPQKLLVTHKKHEILESWGVDLLLELYFEESLAKMSAEKFLKKLMVFNESVFIVGDDFRFGFENKGFFNNSNVITNALNYHVVADVMEMGKKVSSTRIRESISAGEVELASFLLGRMYSLEGLRVVGDRIGRTLGFPTVNLSPPETLIPIDGVYKTNTVLRGRTYRSMSYIGTKPTFSKKSKVVETHLFGFDEEVEPGTPVEVFFKKRIRGDKKFNNKQDLINQLYHDKENSLED